MSRTIKTLNRPMDHMFVVDEDVPADHADRRFCCAVVAGAQGGFLRCALREDDSVHVTVEQLAERLVAELPPTPVEDVSDRILGEG